MGKNTPEKRRMHIDKFYDAQPKVMFSSEAFQLELKEFHKQKPDLLIVGFKVNRVVSLGEDSSALELIPEVSLPSGVGVVYLDIAEIYQLRFPHEGYSDPNDKGIEYIQFPEYVKFSFYTQHFEWFI